MTVNECFVGMLERNYIQDLKQKRGLHYFSIRWFHPCLFFSCSAPSQRRDHSRQEAPGDSAVPPPSESRDGGDQEEDAGDEGGEGLFKDLRIYCDENRWRRTTPATGSMSARSSARLPGSVFPFDSKNSYSYFLQHFSNCHPQLRASKAEDEVEELVTKARQLETELDMTVEKLGFATLQLEEKEKALSASELEMNALTRRVSGLEEDLEKTEEKMVAAVAKLDKAATASDDSERAKKVFQNKADEDEKRISALEKDLKEAREKAEAADASYDEVFFKSTSILLMTIYFARWPRSSPLASQTLRKQRSVQMLERQKSWSWRRS